MKHLDETQASLLARLLVEARLEIGPAVQDALMAYLDAIIEVNRSLNLTRITDPESGVRLHLVDSLLALPEVATAPAGPLLDIGTGGGFPGVPLCVATGRSGTLLDSVGKKARAVNAVLGELRIAEGVSAAPERAEEHARSHRGEYAVVTARAVSELPSLVELAAPLLSQGGMLIALKGSPAPEELERGRLVGSKVGMREVSIRRQELPGEHERRCIVSYERCGHSAIKLPRRTGAAQNTPLA